MAALPTNDQILDRYFQSDDDDSDFEGFSEVGSDVDIPNALDSSEDEQGQCRRTISTTLYFSFIKQRNFQFLM
jgi:hypothetical protein